MQLLEINYSERYDTFTGYLANDPDYFRYEVDQEKVELTPINEHYDDRKDFIREIIRTNPHAAILVDPIQIKDINYRELARYKRLSLATLDGQSRTVPPFPLRRAVLIVFLLLIIGVCYFIAKPYLSENTGLNLPIPGHVEPAKEIQYTYEIHLVSGGTMETRVLGRNGGKILVKDKKGLEVVLDLSAVSHIVKIQRDNSLARSVIYGTKPRMKTDN